MRASRSAPHSTRAILASSDGWAGNGPSWIQREAPFTLTPTPGMSVSPRPTIDAPSSGYAAARNTRGDDRAATYMSGSPSAAPSNCFLKSEYAGRPRLRSCTDEVDSTITRPSPSSSAVMPMIR